MGRSGRLAVVATVTTILVMGPASAALACGGLVAPNGTVNLLRTTTLAAYHGGIEHYITSFTFAGDGEAGEVGSIVPLPGVPTDVVKGGDWTLQRLVIETERLRGGGLELFATAAADATAPAQVLLETQIDALDITVLSGGAIAVGEWAREHGFLLPPDAPEVLEFYASRSPVFMAARFDADRAAEQGIVEGQGTPIHVTIPTPNPWVPLRILALGRQPQELVQADVYLLTDVEPAMLPQAVEGNGDADQRGLVRNLNEPASRELLADLRSDRGMSWLPARHMWLTHVVVNAPAAELTHDLAIDASGFGQPSPVAAGVAGGRGDRHDRHGLRRRPRRGTPHRGDRRALLLVRARHDRGRARRDRSVRDPQRRPDRPRVHHRRRPRPADPRVGHRGAPRPAAR
jgi:hypothetical protein